MKLKYYIFEHRYLTKVWFSGFRSYTEDNARVIAKIMARISIHCAGIPETRLINVTDLENQSQNREKFPH